MSSKNICLKRGDIVFVDLSPVTGSEQGGIRPALVIQNNIGNFMSPTTIVASITKSKTKAIIPTHYYIGTANGLLIEESMVLFEQIRTIDKKRIIRKVGSLPLNIEQVAAMEKCINISIGNFSYEDEFVCKDNHNQDKDVNCEDFDYNYKNGYIYDTSCDCDLDYDYTKEKYFNCYFERSMIDIDEECTYLCTGLEVKKDKQENINKDTKIEKQSIEKEKTKNRKNKNKNNNRIENKTINTTNTIIFNNKEILKNVCIVDDIDF